MAECVPMELSPSERAGEVLEASHAEHNSQVWFNLKLCLHLGIWVGVLIGRLDFVYSTDVTGEPVRACEPLAWG